MEDAEDGQAAFAEDASDERVNVGMKRRRQNDDGGDSPSSKRARPESLSADMVHLLNVCEADDATEEDLFRAFSRVVLNDSSWEELVVDKGRIATVARAYRLAFEANSTSLTAADTLAPRLQEGLRLLVLNPLYPDSSCDDVEAAVLLVIFAQTSFPEIFSLSELFISSVAEFITQRYMCTVPAERDAVSACLKMLSVLDKELPHMTRSGVCEALHNVMAEPWLSASAKRLLPFLLSSLYGSPGATPGEAVATCMENAGKFSTDNFHSLVQIMSTCDAFTGISATTDITRIMEAIDSLCRVGKYDRRMWDIVSNIHDVRDNFDYRFEFMAANRNMYLNFYASTLGQDLSEDKYVQQMSTVAVSIVRNETVPVRCKLLIRSFLQTKVFIAFMELPPDVQFDIVSVVFDLHFLYSAAEWLKEERGLPLFQETYHSILWEKTFTYMMRNAFSPSAALFLRKSLKWPLQVEQFRQLQRLIGDADSGWFRQIVEAVALAVKDAELPAKFDESLQHFQVALIERLCDVTLDEVTFVHVANVLRKTPHNLSYLRRVDTKGLVKNVSRMVSIVRPLAEEALKFLIAELIVHVDCSREYLQLFIAQNGTRVLDNLRLSVVPLVTNCLEEECRTDAIAAAVEHLINRPRWQLQPDIVSSIRSLIDRQIFPHNHVTLLARSLKEKNDMMIARYLAALWSGELCAAQSPIAIATACTAHREIISVEQMQLVWESVPPERNQSPEKERFLDVLRTHIVNTYKDMTSDICKAITGVLVKLASSGDGVLEYSDDPVLLHPFFLKRVLESTDTEDALFPNQAIKSTLRFDPAESEFGKTIILTVLKWLDRHRESLPNVGDELQLVHSKWVAKSQEDSEFVFPWKRLYSLLQESIDAADTNPAFAAGVLATLVENLSSGVVEAACQLLVSWYFQEVNGAMSVMCDVLQRDTGYQSTKLVTTLIGEKRDQRLDEDVEMALVVAVCRHYEPDLLRIAAPLITKVNMQAVDRVQLRQFIVSLIDANEQMKDSVLHILQNTFINDDDRDEFIADDGFAKLLKISQPRAYAIISLLLTKRPDAFLPSHARKLCQLIGSLQRKVVSRTASVAEVNGLDKSLYEGLKCVQTLLVESPDVGRMIFTGWHVKSGDSDPGLLTPLRKILNSPILPKLVNGGIYLVYFLTTTLRTILQSGPLYLDTGMTYINVIPQDRILATSEVLTVLKWLHERTPAIYTASFREVPPEVQHRVIDVVIALTRSYPEAQLATAVVKVLQLYFRRSETVPRLLNTLWTTCTANDIKHDVDVCYFLLQNDVMAGHHIQEIAGPLEWILQLSDNPKELSRHLNVVSAAVKLIGSRPLECSGITDLAEKVVTTTLLLHDQGIEATWRSLELLLTADVKLGEATTRAIFEKINTPIQEDRAIHGVPNVVLALGQRNPTIFTEYGVTWLKSGIYYYKAAIVAAFEAIPEKGVYWRKRKTDALLDLTDLHVRLLTEAIAETSSHDRANKAPPGSLLAAAILCTHSSELTHVPPALLVDTIDALLLANAEHRSVAARLTACAVSNFGTEHSIKFARALCQRQLLSSLMSACDDPGTVHSLATFVQYVANELRPYLLAGEAISCILKAALLCEIDTRQAFSKVLLNVSQDPSFKDPGMFSTHRHHVARGVLDVLMTCDAVWEVNRNLWEIVRNLLFDETTPLFRVFQHILSSVSFDRTGILRDLPLYANDAGTTLNHDDLHELLVSLKAWYDVGFTPRLPRGVDIRSLMSASDDCTLCAASISLLWPPEDVFENHLTPMIE